MTPLERLNQILQTIDDYSEELWADIQFRDNMMFLLARYINEGTDLSDEELVVLDGFIKEKIEKLVKEKAN